MQQLELVPYLLYEKEENGILWIKFNFPEKLNAVVGASERNGTLAKIGEYMRAGDDDPDVRVMILTGVGRAFCAGSAASFGGIEGFAKGDNFLGNGPVEGADATRQQFMYGNTKLIRDISYVKKPTIAMVNGPAAGFGMDLALMCDVRYGSEKTRFITYHQVGQIIENGGCYMLPRLMGLGRALEFAFIGTINGDEAYEYGMLNKLFPSEDLEAETRKRAEMMLKNPPVSQWINKRVIRAAIDTSLETTAVMTSNAALILGQTEDAKEARAAMMEKRDPVFKGR